MEHLTLALQLENSGALKAVEEAIKFCKLELKEVKEWRNILSQKNQNIDDNEISKSLLKRKEDNSKSLSLFEYILPIKMVENVAKKIVRNLLTVTGICNDYIKQKDENSFHGIFGFFGSVIQKACKYDVDKEHVHDRNRKSSSVRSSGTGLLVGDSKDGKRDEAGEMKKVRSLSECFLL